MTKRAFGAPLWFALFFAAALLPRLSIVTERMAFADDLIHRPGGHLLSYRFLNYAELWVWEALAGRDYLLGIAPGVVVNVD